jgi:hypothetical protein
MSDSGRINKPPANAEVRGDSSVGPTVPESFRSVDPAKAFGPSRFDRVRAEREAAAAQIHRSMKAWRAGQGKASAANIPQGAGAPLGGDIRGRMEPKLGASLSGVRVHTGGDSAEAAGKLGARAFTVGSDVHFNAGEFSPGSKEGDRLLAHELTHVVQGQRSGIQRKTIEDNDAMGDAKGGEKSDAKGEEKGDAEEVSSPEEPAEKEADAVADDVTDDLHQGNEGNDNKKKDEDGFAEGEGADEKPAPIAAKLDHSASLKVYRGDKNKKDPTKRKLKTTSSGSAPKLGNMADLYDRAVADDIDAAQTTMNDLYRDGASYGDGSCAYVVLLAAAQGKDPTGKDHYGKSKMYITNFDKVLNGQQKPNLPADGLGKIQEERDKLQEAVDWHDANLGKKGGQRTPPPKWATKQKAWKAELDK